MIDACCRALETEKAFQLLVQMRQQLGQEPNSSTYAALLESCARAGNVEQARWPHPRSPHHAVGRCPARHATHRTAALDEYGNYRIIQSSTASMADTVRGPLRQQLPSPSPPRGRSYAALMQPSKPARPLPLDGRGSLAC